MPRVNMSMDIEIHHEDQLRRKAYDVAIDAGLEPIQAEDYLDHDVMSLGQCVIMVFDPGLIERSGSSILSTETEEY